MFEAMLSLAGLALVVSAISIPVVIFLLVREHRKEKLIAAIKKYMVTGIESIGKYIP